jgi:Tfp pilus assembly protein PilN
MRPVNLIPPEDRRGDRAPLRAGALSYIVVGAFAAVLVAVLALVFTQNSITEHENEIAQLEVARDAAAERAAALAPYAEFASLQAQREQTIMSLAQSRFDWERVLRELALVIPPSIDLKTLDASATGDTEGAEETDAQVPSLNMAGCAPTHDDVAEFVAALEDIDGITRVGLENSTKTSESAAAASGGGDGDSEAGCPPGEVSFVLSAVFDAVQVDAAATPPPASPSTPAATGTDSAEEQVAEAEEAANLIPGAAR